MQRLIVFIFVKTIQYSHTLKNNNYHSNKQGPPSFFHLDTSPVPCCGPFCWQNPCSSGRNSGIDLVVVHSVDKTLVLIITVELIWLYTCSCTISFNFAPTQRKSLRLTRFRRRFVNRPAVVLINYCQSYTAFLLDVRYSKWPCSFFCSYLFPVIMHLRGSCISIQ